MKKTGLLALAVMLGIAGRGEALNGRLLLVSEPEPYVSGNVPFVSITDVNQEAKAWAICSASYELVSEITRDMLNQPAMAEHLMNLSRGASLAVGISQVADMFGQEGLPSTERFNSTWAFSKHTMEEIPKAQMAWILADAELLGEEGFDIFVQKLGATVQVCQSNLKEQQMYIDLWREIAKSGLLEIPSE
jgi:hypothetical protein